MFFSGQFNYLSVFLKVKGKELELQFSIWEWCWAILRRSGSLPHIQAISRPMTSQRLSSRSREVMISGDLFDQKLFFGKLLSWLLKKCIFSNLFQSKRNFSRRQNHKNIHPTTHDLIWPDLEILGWHDMVLWLTSYDASDWEEWFDVIFLTMRCAV